MLAKVPSAALHGIDGFSVLVEVHVSAGMPGFSIVGLPDTTCRESRDRVRAALQTSHMTWPPQRATVSLSPPGLRKAGAGLDLAIAMGLLVASEQLREEYLGGRAFLGALGLDGSIRPVPGALPLIDALDSEEIVIPAQSVVEARLVGRHRIRVAKNLEQLVMALTGEEEWPDPPPPEPPLPPDPGPDLADVRGQPAARFALEVAAAGGHHILFVGSPGSGKTMLARRLPGLLPDLTSEQALETTRIHSAAGVALPRDGLIRRPPFRSPHHGASAVSLAGGGSGMMQPGEISLATPRVYTYSMSSAPASTPDLLPVGQLLRISDDREGLGLGVERQSHDNHRLADSRRWHIIETYKDNSKSAYRGRLDAKTGKWISGRPAYDRCLADLRLGRIKGVVAYHPDRVFGNPRELEDLIDLVESTGAVIATCQTGSYDLSTPSGRLIARQLGAASRYEREMKAERQSRKHLELAQVGRVGGGGTRPSGYSCHGRHPEHCSLPDCTHDGTVSIIEAEAALIRESSKRIDAGEALRGVIVDMNARGFRTPDRLRTRDSETGLKIDPPKRIPGQLWGPHTFKRMITSPRIAGLRQYQGRKSWPPTRTESGWSDVIGEAVWPAIVDRAVWERVRQILFDPNRKPRSEPRRYLLSNGLARCQLCDAPLVARPRSDKRRCYVCARGPGFTGCGKIRILAEPLEDMVCEAVLSSLDGPGLGAAMRRTRNDANDNVDGQLAQVDRKLDELEDDLADEIVDRRAYLRRRRRLTEQREALQARMTARDRPKALTVLAGDDGPLRDRWGGLTFDQRRAVLALVLDRVTVGPAVRGRNRFDAGRVGFVWLA